MGPFGRHRNLRRAGVAIAALRVDAFQEISPSADLLYAF
jgi:hypothetical protein